MKTLVAGEIHPFSRASRRGLVFLAPTPLLTFAVAAPAFAMRYAPHHVFVNIALSGARD